MFAKEVFQACIAMNVLRTFSIIPAVLLKSRVLVFMEIVIMQQVGVCAQLIGRGNYASIVPLISTDLIVHQLVQALEN